MDVEARPDAIEVLLLPRSDNGVLQSRAEERSNEAQ